MVIQHNMSSATANRNLNKTSKNLRVSTKRLSTGYRINCAADDAAGLTISEKLRWQIRGLNQASENIQDGISLIQVADGALTEVHAMLDRMKELTIQAANDTNTDDDRDAIQSEIDQIKSEINRISTDTTFNEDIRVFKPTKVPEIKGTPTDILVYHEDYNGGVREGGIIYSGRRYAYEDMKNLDYDSRGNIKAGTYSVGVYAEDGKTPIDIELMFDGGNRVPSGREYRLDPRKDGIYIDLIKHDWNDIKDANGTALDPANLQVGKYSFQHAGLTISFDVDDGMDFNSLLDSLKKDGLETYMLRSSDVTTESLKINPYIAISSVSPVDAAKQQYIPGNKMNNSSYYSMYADANEIYMYIDASVSMTGQKQILTRRTWDELGLNEWKRYNPDPKYNWANPTSTVTGGEKNKVYTYKDDITGISVNFTVDSEISKGELITAMNDWRISVGTNNRMQFEPATSGSVPIRYYTHSQNLDAYGTQYAMGRTMSTKLTLATSQPMTHDAANDKLSFTMTDAKGVTYTFSSGANMAATIKNGVRSDLSSYISRYASAYQNRLNHRGSTPASARDDRIVQFTSDQGGYSMSLQYDEDFSGWLSDSMFTTKQVDVPVYPSGTRKEWRVTYDTTALLNSLSSRINTLSNDIGNSLKSTKMSVHTDTSPTTDSNGIISPDTTKNKRYSSLVISGDREVKIQAGCRQDQYIAIKLPPMNTGILRIGGVDASSYDSASAGIDRIEWAIDYVSNMRSGYGATQNRLEAARAIDDITEENSQKAESLLRDVDMADESVAYARHNILLQVGQSVLVQANHNSDNVLRLLS